MKTLDNYLIERGWAQFNAKYYESALRDFERAIELSPDTPNAYAGRSMVREELGDTTGADKDRKTGDQILQRTIDQNTAAIEANPGDARAHLDRAVAFWLRGNAEDAIRDCDRAIALQPHFILSYVYRGDFHRLHFREERAIEDYTKAISLDGKNIVAHNNRGQAQFALGKYYEAMQDYSAAVKLDPTQARFFDNRGSAWLRVRKLKEAIFDFDKALELDPLYVHAWHNRALAKLEAGDLDGAIDDASSAIRLPGHSAATFNVRGFAYFKKGDYELAIRDHNVALERDRPMKYRLGILLDRGDARLAAKELQEPSRITPQLSGKTRALRRPIESEPKHSDFWGKRRKPCLMTRSTGG